VTVSPLCVNVDYVRSYLPADTLSGIHHNRELAYSFTIGNCTTSIQNELFYKDSIKIFPNPAMENIYVEHPKEMKEFQISLLDPIGRVLLKTSSDNINVRAFQNGIYFLNIKSDKCERNEKLIICH
jgi:hypothetical protein